MKKAIILLAVVMAIYVSPHAMAEDSSIFVVAEKWEGYTNDDGTGLYWELLRLVYEPIGIKLKYKNFPYARAQKMVRGKKADAIAGPYKGEFEPAIFAKWHIDRDAVGASYKKGRRDKW